MATFRGPEMVHHANQFILAVGLQAGQGERFYVKFSGEIYRSVFSAINVFLRVNSLLIKYAPKRGRGIYSFPSGFASAHRAIHVNLPITFGLAFALPPRTSDGIEQRLGSEILH